MIAELPFFLPSGASAEHILGPALAGHMRGPSHTRRFNIKYKRLSSEPTQTQIARAFFLCTRQDLPNVSSSKSQRPRNTFAAQTHALLHTHTHGRWAAQRATLFFFSCAPCGWKIQNAHHTPRPLLAEHGSDLTPSVLSSGARRHLRCAVPAHQARPGQTRPA